MNPVIDERVVLPVTHGARNFGGEGVVAYAKLMIGKRQRMKHGRDTGCSVAFVGLGAGKVERKVHAGARLDLLFQRIAVQVNHARHQYPARQINLACTGRRLIRAD